MYVCMYVCTQWRTTVCFYSVCGEPSMFLGTYYAHKHTNKCVHTHLPIETGVYIHILYLSIAFALRYALENRDVLGSGLGTTPFLPLSTLLAPLSHMYFNVRVFMDR